MDKVDYLGSRIEGKNPLIFENKQEKREIRGNVKPLLGAKKRLKSLN
jgi:hypothetical protein